MKTLLVAASGGHLAQLHRLAPRLGLLEDEHLWVTFDGPQSRALLNDEPVLYVPYVGPRDVVAALRNFPAASRVLRSGRFDGVVSTGSAVAMSFLPLARLYRKRAVYIESAARSSGPSLTGRLLAATPGTLLCTQYPQWATERWQYIGSVFDGFESERCEDDHEDHDRPLKVVVTLGLIVGYGFRRLIERLLQILPADADVLWQVGDTDTRDLPITAFRSLYWTDLRDAIADADVVVAHTGVGSALAALELGKCPVLVPRAASHDEHVDDHQLQIAVQLARRGLAVHRSVEALTLADLHEAMAVRVRDRTRELPPMRL